MKINKTRLLKALEKVKPGLATKEIIEQSTHFAFMGDRVVTYNDEISISCYVPDLELTGAVSAQELYAFLNRIKAEEIEAEVTENEIRLRTGKLTAGLILQPEIRLPLQEIGDIEEWYQVPDEFMKALTFCRFSCSSDMSRPILTCVHVGTNFVESSDNVRYTYHGLSDIDERRVVPEFLIPGDSVNNLSKYDINEIAISKGWVHFRTTDKTVIFSCRIFDDRYPNTMPIRELVEDSVEVIFPKLLPEVLDRASVFAKAQFDSDTMISLTLKNKKILIEAKNTVGWFKEELPVRYKGKTIKFLINPTFLIEMLDKTKSCWIGGNKIKFGEDSQEGWMHVIGLIPEEIESED
jgi:DNA polymerase III sliding clamp (beta) subunit (PCNA family)